MKWLQSSYFASFRQAVGRALPTLGTALAGVAAGVVLVISCNMGPSISMAGGTTGGDTSGGSTGGSAGGGTSGGSTGGGGGSCNCSFSGPVTLAGPVTVTGSVTNVPAIENSAQLVSGRVTSATTGAFDCSTIAQDGVPFAQFSTKASCVKLVDGPFVLTDLVSIFPVGGGSQPSNLTETWVFAAPPSANWDSTTQVEWVVAQNWSTPIGSIATTGMHYVVPAGSSLYGVSNYAGIVALNFSWSGFTPYQ